MASKSRQGAEDFAKFCKNVIKNFSEIKYLSNVSVLCIIVALMATLVVISMYLYKMLVFS